MLGHDDGARLAKGDSGAIIHRLTGKTCPPAYIITIVDDPDMSDHQKAALIAHEATHIAQHMWRDLNEKTPGDEAEAYVVQFVLQGCLYAMDKMREARKK